MTQRGRPPKPLEQKRRTGRTPTTDSGGRKLPAQSQVVALPMAAGIPDLPADMELDGQRLWTRCWAAGISWISPLTDMEAVEQACRLADDVAVARERYRATRDPKDGAMVNAFVKQLASALSDLGFNPTARSRLGVAEVTRVSKLQQLRDARVAPAVVDARSDR